MLSVTRRRLRTLISCLVAVNLMIAPVAHASVMMFSETHTTSMSANHSCDSQEVDLVSKVVSTTQNASQMNGDMGMDCEHGTNCKVLCSISVSALYSNSPLSAIENTSHWLLVESPSSKSSILSRLERPPRL